jgi:hypothetical protein
MVFRECRIIGLIVKETSSRSRSCKVFLTKKSASSKFLTWSVVWEVLKTLTKVMLKNCYKVMHVNWASSTWQTDIVNVTVKQKGEKEGTVNESEIRIDMRRSSKKLLKINDHYKLFLKTNVGCVKKCKVICGLWMHQMKYFLLSIFFDYLCVFSPPLAQMIWSLF